ncbi:DUF1904 family protein [Spiroplasma apis]|uniref:DUF1904 family protein n=1 Tax=Spiroplasma apis B31 TaxID=1276258 RepID=V5RH47_SPIAP|nr:DUF1904 family protein [Spiroplasma apis]AHB35864.1 hypothetical protein SAPIS_v1c00170 [Spiroplasma apis B31]
MPIFSFRGVPEEKVREYYNKVDEIGKLINANVKKIVFWFEPYKLIGDSRQENAILVKVDWIGRPLKQELLAKHIQENFSNYSDNIYVQFNEVNNFLYLNGVCVG